MNMFIGKPAAVKIPTRTPTTFVELMAYLHAHVQLLNSSRFFAGAMIVLLNVASKFTTIKLSKTMEAYLRHTFSRDALVFAIAWMGSRDIYVALTMVVVFTILADYLTNEASDYCILSHGFCSHHLALHEGYGVEGATDGGGVSHEEIKKAIDVLKKAYVKTKDKVLEKEYKGTPAAPEKPGDADYRKFSAA
jgi:hypothetical protein